MGSRGGDIFTTCCLTVGYSCSALATHLSSPLSLVHLISRPPHLSSASSLVHIISRPHHLSSISSLAHSTRHCNRLLTTRLPLAHCSQSGHLVNPASQLLQINITSTHALRTQSAAVHADLSPKLDHRRLEYLSIFNSRPL